MEATMKTGMIIVIRSSDEKDKGTPKELFSMVYPDGFYKTTWKNGTEWGDGDGVVVFSFEFCYEHECRACHKPMMPHEVHDSIDEWGRFCSDKCADRILANPGNRYIT